MCVSVTFAKCDTPPRWKVTWNLILIFNLPHCSSVNQKFGATEHINILLMKYRWSASRNCEHHTLNSHREPVSAGVPLVHFRLRAPLLRLSIPHTRSVLANAWCHVDMEFSTIDMCPIFFRKIYKSFTSFTEIIWRAVEPLSSTIEKGDLKINYWNIIFLKTIFVFPLHSFFSFFLCARATVAISSLIN